MERVRDEQRKRGSERELPAGRSREQDAEKLFPVAMTALIDNRKLVAKLAFSVVLNIVLAVTLLLVVFM